MTPSMSGSPVRRWKSISVKSRSFRNSWRSLLSDGPSTIGKMRTVTRNSSVSSTIPRARSCIVYRTFLDAHGADYIIPALKELAFLVCLRIAGGRSVIVKSQMIEIEKGIARGDVDPRAPDDVVSWVERVRVKPGSRSRPSIRLSRHQVPDDRLDRHQRRARPG
jgi:hypothetical protein